MKVKSSTDKSMIIINCFIYFILNVSYVFASASIKGKVDLRPKSLTISDISRITLTLHQIYNYKNDNITISDTKDSYYASTKIINTSGDFKFDNLPLIKGFNKTTYFVLHSNSLDYNLRPNRVLYKFVSLDEDANKFNVTAYQNLLGREYFPSPEIAYPENLLEINADPYLNITYVRNAPMRLYYQHRKPSFLETGIIGNILSSRWKTAAVVTALCLAIFPLVAEKLDPETTRLIKEEALKKQREKYQS
ncbi:hypothetical protein TPHA_0E03500 [Tetrapisispora phaffii CBS 4417]|uniref:Protein SOP4 n=1 Tax=Tetrapisispora phaffii (strain ATCC 24235 / CBS 4417 / NBRC 1672 / NRRL Y-8282 / UCD 70-5) TaxID=1071381 RepID=G8BU62_TETPH|nr:hypothetical protein TPHA_0E03500 [Tetrapisispora phaffii CBS 4417]CCE63440.1 hypothetical protein TPHA_0E03500 [Tetrapisispora phaffii CBS 4417]